MKEEKGAITLFVLVSCMFMIIILLVVNIGVMNKNRSQEKNLEEIAKQYSQNETDLDNVYAKVTNENEYLTVSEMRDMFYPVGSIYITTNNQNPTTKTLVSTPNSLDGYVPRNQKLRTYPYLYLGFNPNNGTSKIFRYEDFTNGSPQFKIISEVNPNPTICFIPQNYRGATGDSLSDLATLNGYPTLSNKSDYYNTWLAQNSQIISLQMQQEQFNYEAGQLQTGLNMLSNIGNVLTGDFGSSQGIINGGLELARADKNHDFYIKQQMAQIEKQAMLPDKANLSSSNATLMGYNLIDKNIFTRYTIKSQFAERIDKYFDMYGYLTNKVKVPNLNNRPNWNYIKTIGANILGNIPQQDLNLIKDFFNNGITLWHNTSTFLDYSQNNRI